MVQYYNDFPSKGIEYFHYILLNLFQHIYSSQPIKTHSIQILK